MYIDVRVRDLGIEGTRSGRESTRKIFERGARSGQPITRLRVKAEKRWQSLKTKRMEGKSAGY
jgi:hypothetical protein